MPVLLLALVLMAACAPAGTASSPSPSAQSGDSIGGTLRVVGSAPMNVRLVLEGPGGNTGVAGPLADELRRLAGAEVMLTGRREGSTITATDYRIVSVNGQPATLGTVESVTGSYVQLRTAEGELVYLAGTSGQFQVGQKVWVQGPRAVVVQTFGTVRP